MSDSYEEMSLIIQITSDPQFNKRFIHKVTDDDELTISKEVEKELMELRTLGSSEKAILVSKIASIEDFQTQIKLVHAVQHRLDRIHEINTDLYILQHRWGILYKEANDYLNYHFYNSLNPLKESLRKVVLTTVLSPIEAGMDKLDTLVKVGEKTYTHLITTNWNLKEASTLIREYLTTLKAPSLRNL